MVSSLTYTPGTFGSPAIDLYDPHGLMIGDISGLRKREWSYDAGYRSIQGVTRPVADRDLELTSVDSVMLDTLMNVADADLSNLTPGTITVNGAWTQRCYLTVSDPSGEVPSPRLQKITLTATLLDGVWRSDMPTISVQPNAPDDDGSDGSLDLPADLSHDLGKGSPVVLVTNPLFAPLSWRMTWYGPVSSPHLTIAGNLYLVDVDVPDGARLDIDSVSKTITLTMANGDSSNVFAYGLRGTGIGGGRYIFQPIPAGDSHVEWDGSFGFDLTPILEETTPPWQTLN